MALELTCGGQTTCLDLAEGRFTLGGGVDDDVQVAGVPPRFLLLLVEGPRLTFTALRPVRVGPALCPARVPRLLLEGEAVALPGGAELRRALDPAGRERRRALGTARLARELLAGEFQLEGARVATLTCVAGPDLGARFVLGSEASVLGRGPQAEVRLRDLAVSRRHAVVAWEGTGACLKALRSLNGVFVNGQPLEGSRALRAGDVVELGQTLLRFEAPEPTRAGAAGVPGAEGPAGEASPKEAPPAALEAAPPPGSPPPPRSPSRGEARPGSPALPPPPSPPTAERASALEVGLVALGSLLAVGTLGASALLLARGPW